MTEADCIMMAGWSGEVDGRWSRTMKWYHQNDGRSVMVGVGWVKEHETSLQRTINCTRLSRSRTRSTRMGEVVLMFHSSPFIQPINLAFPKTGFLSFCMALGSEIAEIASNSRDKLQVLSLLFSIIS